MLYEKLIAKEEKLALVWLDYVGMTNVMSFFDGIIPIRINDFVTSCSFIQ